ncbi:MAG: AMP-binding protein [Burkholderiaceae bacterium]
MSDSHHAGPSAHLDSFARDRLPPPEQWPVFLFDRPEYRYPEFLNCAAELLDRHVEQGHGEHPAVGMLVDGKPVWASYRQLLNQANRIAHVLKVDLGLVPGNRVLLRAPNNPMMAACWLAVMKAGLIAVPTMPLLRSKELEQTIKKAKVGAALCDATLADELRHCLDPAHPHHAPDLRQVLYFNGGGEHSLEARLIRHPDSFENVKTARDDICLLAFTSGTTGEPKATVHFHRDVMVMCDAFPRHILKPGPNDIFCGTPPLAFTFGLGGLLCFPLRYGAASLLSERLTPELLLKTIGLSGATICFTAPTFYRQMALLLQDPDREFSIDSLRQCVSAGEALPGATRQLWRQASGIEMIDGIGGTEVMHIYISSCENAVREGAIGQVVPGYRAKIVDEAMNEMPPGSVGRLAIQGPTGCRYLADARQKNYVRDGWNLPGDAFSMDQDGYFFYHARTDDMIVSAGYNIAGPEVESVMLTHPAVAECGVVGVEDLARGQLVKAFVVLRPDSSPSPELVADLQNWVKSRIAPYKYPRVIEFCAELPRTETGKLQRYRLRQVSGA